MDPFLINSTSVLNTTNNTATDRDICKDRIAGFMFFRIVESIIAIVGFPANLRTLQVLWGRVAASYTSDVFIGNLAVLDALFCLFTPVTFVHCFNLNNPTIFGAVNFFFMINEIGAPLFLCCVCLDRYVAVLQPICFLRYKDLAYRAGSSAAVWVIAVAISFCLTFQLGKQGSYITTGIFCSTFALMIFCNLSILWALQRAAPGAQEMHPIKKKAFNTVLTSLVVLIFNFSLLIMLFLIDDVLPQYILKCYIIPIGHSLVTMRISIQPLLFLYSAGKMPCLTNSN
ncbi:GP83A protein, partial [Amia calva]|nr:GP83A protein [Amia calva]